MKLDKTLFWDVKFKDLDYEKHANFIVGRVLNYGDESDYKEIKKEYGVRKIKRIARDINYTNKKNINFWSFILNIPINSFKCTKKFSTKKQSIFSPR